MISPARSIDKGSLFASKTLRISLKGRFRSLLLSSSSIRTQSRFNSRYCLLAEELFQLSVLEPIVPLIAQLLGELFDLDLVGMPVELSPLDFPEST